MRFWLPGAARRAMMTGMCAMLLAGPALAADTSADKDKGAALVPAILIVDIQQVLHDSKAGKGVQASLSQESQTYSKEVARQEDDLQKMRSDLERQRTVLSAAAFDSKAKALQQHYQELRRAVQAKQQGLEKSYSEAMLKVDKAALNIIAELAKERGANLVLAKQATILQPATSDVTAEVVTRLDKALPSVAVSMPKSSDSATPRRRDRRKDEAAQKR
ncbi:MAG TPA: OmpH family outer membrane protein [Stellaceae bacterium]